MYPKPAPFLKTNTYEYESAPMVKATGFREYDARWLFGKEINLLGVQALGLGLGTYFHELGIAKRVVTGHDYRSYSLSIKQALTLGLMNAGCEVVDIGLATIMKLAKGMGAETITLKDDDVAQALSQFVRANGITHIVQGHPGKKALFGKFRKSITEILLETLPEVHIIMI